ncbi:hypothetical protein ACFRAR_29550 [Kitasatospora sp. NPDC056651]
MTVITTGRYGTAPPAVGATGGGDAVARPRTAGPSTPERITRIKESTS